MPMRLSICGFDQLDEFRGAGVSHVVSILDPGPDDPDPLQSFGPHERLDLRFHDIIDEEANMVCPQRDDIARLLQFGRALPHGAEANGHLLVHCHAGMSRSTAAMVVLLAQAAPDDAAEAAVARTLALRPNAWPNLRMIELGDELLARNGTLIAAVRRHYRDMVRRFPEFGQVMMRGRHLRDAPVD